MEGYMNPETEDCPLNFMMFNNLFTEKKKKKFNQLIIIILSEAEHIYYLFYHLLPAIAILLTWMQQSRGNQELLSLHREAKKYLTCCRVLFASEHAKHEVRPI